MKSMTLLASFCLAAAAFAADMKPPSFADFDRRARAGEQLSVVFFGGSLTWGANATDPQRTSWRALMSEWLREKYPKASFAFHDAAIGGTGSKLGMFRLERDVLSRHPDLVFLDFTVNDTPEGADSATLASYECLVRRMVEQGIPVMQVLLGVKNHTGKNFDPATLPRYRDHKKISEAYGTGMADVVARVATLVAEGKADPKLLWPVDGTHPEDPGYLIYFETVRDAYELAVAEGRTCQVPAQVVFSDRYKDRSRQVLAAGDLPAGWHRDKPFRTAMWFDGMSSRWMGEVAVCSAKDKASAEPLRVEFDGTMVGLFGEKNGNGLSFRAKIDGRPVLRSTGPKTPPSEIWENNTRRGGGGNLFSWIELTDKLAPGRHVLEIEPIFDENTPTGELRIESVCSAGPINAVTEITSTGLKDAMAAKRFETARRIGMQLMEDPKSRQPQNIFLLHDAFVALADFKSARELLERFVSELQADRFTVALKLGRDLRRLTSEDHYRTSEEAGQGMTLDEYADKYRALADAKLAEARKLATTPEQLAALNPNASPTPAAAPTLKEPAKPELSTVRGRIFLPNGKPAADVTVTLGLATQIDAANPQTYQRNDMSYAPKVGRLEKLAATTTKDGGFTLKDVPAGTHDFLAVTLDPAKFDISTRFLARSVEVKSGETNLGDLTANEWRSAPPAPFQSPHPDAVEVGGEQWTKLAEWRMHNPFYYDFPLQLLRLPLPAGVDARSIRAAIEPRQAEVSQIVGKEVALLAALPARSDRTVAIYRSDKSREPLAGAPLKLVEESASVLQIDSGTASFRVAGKTPPETTAPILAVRAKDGPWRGNGRLVLPEDVRVKSQSTRIVEQGPLLLELETNYELTNGTRYSLSITALAGQPYLLAHERSPELAGAAFEFSLREFAGGRGFLHWSPENGSLHWTTLQKANAVVGKLPESIPWWVPPQGFAYAITPDGLEQSDYIGVFTIRRGDWIDRKFEKVAQGPIDEQGRENRELDWPFPEMLGSPISMITARTAADGDAFFQFAMFDGERRWGLLASSLSKNDGPSKELSEVQHANSSPRLQDFISWNLDEQDSLPRPHLIASRDQLRALREKSKSPAFAEIWKKIRDGSPTDVPRSGTRGATAGLTFAIEGDPLIAWRKRAELLATADVCAKMTLLGRDWGDMYSPVGGRPITHWAEDYDLIAASGVFTPEEERKMRAFFTLLGHMYMETDFMNWKFNARNANFEADRTDIVGTIGLAFEGNRAANKFLDHVTERMRRALEVYCTPGSGKWHENPACYYLQALKCRMNLAYHLARTGRIDLEAVPRLKDFLRWGVILLTPPIPADNTIMRDGKSAADFQAMEKVRRIPPIGDHAHLGAAIPESYPLLSDFFRTNDPAFADQLLWAYQASGSDGGYFGNLPLLFARGNDPAASQPAQPDVLQSRRLEGFGAVFRGEVGRDNEFYFLLKQGPGGYRYHRTEGSFILFADGKPLVYDGGEAGETWRHSTLSFYDARMPLAPGHVERFASFPGIDFSQGVHPTIIKPGEPVFLSDNCDPDLVPVAWKRFAEPNPADVRSAVWVKDEYVIVADDLKIDPAIPSRWHLQVVADSETGDAAKGYLFKGRFGTDLQVLLPNQKFAEEKVESVPIVDLKTPPGGNFAMRHLSLLGSGADHYLAVLRPLSGKKQPLTAEALTAEGKTIGVRVRGSGIDDEIFLGRTPMQIDRDGIQFQGRYAAVTRRGSNINVALFDKGQIKAGSIEIRSTGPAVYFDAAKSEVIAEGAGKISIIRDGRTTDLELTGKRVVTPLK
jgi:lysophospholipase L1-like esterase